MRYVLLALSLLAVTPAQAQRVCQQVGQSVQCSDGTYLPKTQAPKKPPKDGAFEYFPNGTVCQAFGKQRYCR